MTLLERIKDAYEKIGYKPVRRSYVNHEAKVCCPLAAISLKELGRDIFVYPHSLSRMGKILNHDMNWVWGFIKGFDGYSEYDLISEDDKDGYNSGKEIGKALFGE